MTTIEHKLIVVTVSGFQQNRWGRHGFARLHARISEAFPSRKTAPLIALEDWRVNPVALADKIAECHRMHDRLAHIAIASYSWANPTCRQVIDRLDEHRIAVKLWMMVDPVVRPRQIWFSPINLVALLKLGSFPRPTNVERLVLWRQENTRPLGRRVRGLRTIDREHVFGRARRDDGAGYTFHPRPDVGHNEIDDLDEVHNAFVRELERITNTEPAP